MNLKETLYWMQLNDEGIDEVGYLMTKDQLLKELPDVYEAPVFGDTYLRQPRQTNAEDIERYIKEDMETYHQDIRGFEGEYSPNCTFFVQEVTDETKLIELITWKNYDPCKGCTAVEMNEEYPDYVPKELQLSACVYGCEPGWTSEVLPKSSIINFTIKKYAKELDLVSLRKEYTDVEKAAMEISKTLHCGDLTREEFEAICDSYNVYLAYDIQWDTDEIEKNTDNLKVQMEDFKNGNINRYDDIKICDTPAICLAIGMDQKPMLYTKHHLNDAIRGKHDLDENNIVNMPRELSDPVMIFDSLSRKDSVVIVTSEFDKNNAPVIVAVQPDGKGTYNLKRVDANFILSIYGKDNDFTGYIDRAISQNNMLFCNKEKTERLFSVLQLQLPQGFNSLSYNCIIQQSSNIVKHSSSITKENNLPNCVVIPTEVAEKARQTGDIEIISDWLSDTFGFCHEGFQISEKLQHAIDHIAKEQTNIEEERE